MAPPAGGPVVTPTEDGRRALGGGGAFVAFLFLFLPIGAVVGVLFGGAAHALDTGLSGETRTAVESFVEQAGFYAGDLGLLLLLLTASTHAPGGTTLTALGWRPVAARWIALALPLTAATLLLASLLSVVSQQMLPHAINTQCQSVRNDFGHILPVAIPAVSIVAPIVEETVFRGYIHGWLRARMGGAPAVVVSSLIFGAAHLTPLLFLPLAAVGVVLALVYERAGSIWPGVVIHALFNLVGIIAILNATSC